MGCALSRLRNSKRAKCYQVDDRQHNDDRVAEQQDPQYNITATSADPGAPCHTHEHSTAAKRAHHEPASVDKPAVPQAVQQKTKLDPKDYMFTGLQSETGVKLPGSVKGQQFIIDNCKDCNLFVMDHCASVTIDDCSNCRIFIGPTEASLFIRDCQDCSLATITRQLRCRDCSSCNLLLLVRTRPIIESSSSMAFGCYDLPYAGLGAQMAAAQLSPFHNFWSSVFDFTPAAAPTATAGQQQAAANWRLLPGSASVQQLLGDPVLPEAVQQLLGACNADNAAAVSSYIGTAAAAAAAAVKATVGEVPGADSMPAAAALSQADCMCVIRTSRQHAHQQEQCVGSSGTSSSCSLFVMFPAGQHTAALQWTHSNIQQQQQQQQHQEAPQCQEQQPDAGATVEEHHATADASPADVTVSCSASETMGPAAAAAAAVVLHTNEASIPAAVLQQIATAAGWSKQQVKQLGVTTAVKGKAAAGACVGLEVACSTVQVRQQLCSSAEAVGALCCTSTAAAALFRDLGVDG